MKYLIFLLLISTNVFSQKLVCEGDTMYKLLYEDSISLSEAINNESYHVLGFTTKSNKVVVNLKSNTVRYGLKRFKIVEVFEPEVGIFHRYELERRNTIYELLIGDNCRGGITLIFRYMEDGLIIARYFPSVMLKR